MTVVTAADGAQLHVDDRGEGMPIVLIHGGTEDSRSWDPVACLLVEAGYRTVAVDLRGHGRSDRTPPYGIGPFTADLDAVVEALELEDPLVIGHSLGGAVGGALVAGGNTRGMINVDGELRLGSYTDGMKRVVTTLEQDPHLGRDSVDAFFRPHLGPLLPERERQRLDEIRDVDPEVMIPLWTSILSMTEDELDDTMAMLASVVEVPYLFIHGSDPGAAYRRRIGELLPWAEFEIWPDHGHYPHLVDPERFVRCVVAFDPAR